ncbi:SIMPL domain-containing protein [Candidatus Parcubacteria bacterium]|nr:SIMPL domain-containing protein [Candidatus Parcubacteria bacterium]
MQNENTQSLIKWGRIVLIMLGVFLIVEALVGLKSLRTPTPAVNVISITGTGEVMVVPDIATVSYTVSADAKDVATAQESVTTKMDNILNALKNLGIDDKDVKTTNYNVYPKYTYTSTVCTVNNCPPSRQIPDGYTVSHDITVKIRKTDNAGKVLAALGSNGATNISSVTFTTDDPEKVQNEARDKAIADAKSKAEVLSKSLDIDLDHIVNFYDNSGYPYPVYGMGGMDLKAQSAAPAVAPTLPTGENKVTSSVTLVYEIR